MTEIKNAPVDRAYSAKTPQEAEDAYDDWAESYENDLLTYGFRLPFIASAVWARFVKPDEGLILDAGCGTGLQAESLYFAGYKLITGIDLSNGMLNVAKKKNIYCNLQKMMLGEILDFEDEYFSNTISIGTITPGHAPPHSFEELIRVTKKGGVILFSLRVDDGQDPSYPEAIELYAKENRWEKLFETEEFAPMPNGEPDVKAKVFVYRVL